MIEFQGAPLESQSGLSFIYFSHPIAKITPGTDRLVNHAPPRQRMGMVIFKGGDHLIERKVIVRLVQRQFGW